MTNRSGTGPVCTETEPGRQVAVRVRTWTFRWLPVLLLAMAAALPMGAQPGEANPADADVRQRVERILETPGYQTDLPVEEAAPPLPEPPPVPPWLGDLLRVLMWVGIVAVLVMVILAVADAFRRRGSRPSPVKAQAPTPAAPPRPADVAPDPLPDAEALAREGRFGEAVHALLLHALARLARRRGTALPPSLTSREVLGRSGLEGESRQALGELVAGAERFVFAGQPLDGEDWERCRAAFRAVDAGTEAVA